MTRVNYKQTVEHILHKVQSRAGYRHSQKTLAKMVLANTGKKRTVETKLKMSLAKIGRKNKPHSTEARVKMSLASKGVPKSDSHKKSLSIARKKNPVRFWLGKKRTEMSGERNWRWIKDRSKIKTSDRSFNDPNSKIWSRNVKNRDGWKCKIANDTCSGQLEAHHILPWRDYPELRYEINNGITLCHAHHPRKKEDVAKLSPFFQELVASIE